MCKVKMPVLQSVKKGYNSVQSIIMLADKSELLQHKNCHMRPTSAGKYRYFLPLMKRNHHSGNLPTQTAGNRGGVFHGIHERYLQLSLIPSVSPVSMSSEHCHRSRSYLRGKENTHGFKMYHSQMTSGKIRIFESEPDFLKLREQDRIAKSYKLSVCRYWGIGGYSFADTREAHDLSR